MSRTKSAQKRAAFTLIELMIVVGILGILASVAVPAFLSYMRRSRTSEVHQTLKDLYYATKHYFQVERSDRNGNVAGTRCLVDGPGAGYMEPANPGSVKQQFNPATHVSWGALEFNVLEPIYFGYTVLTDKSPMGGDNCPMPGTSTSTGNVYSLRAHGDLDDDGIHSTFEVVVDLTLVELQRNGTTFVHDEDE